MYPFDMTYLVMIVPVMLFAFYAQTKVGSTFKKYASIGNKNSYTGAQAAMRLLDYAGIHDVSVERIRGNLTDHYDPRTKILRLSDTVYDSKSLSAIGVAAHETGHAVQHNRGYAFLTIRSAIVPVVSFCGNLAGPLASIGLMLVFMSSRGTFGYTLIEFGIVLFTAVVAFHLITLPVELNASNRAIAMLSESGVLSNAETGPARKVLDAAALTYVASAAVAIANLLRLVLIVANGRRRS